MPGADIRSAARMRIDVLGWGGHAVPSCPRATIGRSRMSEGRLVIGNRRYSSWSLRGWLAVRLAGLDVDVELIPFSRPGPTEAIGRISPNGLVPYLEHRGARVWESLSVCEYCAEITPALWPVDRVARAHARSI